MKMKNIFYLLLMVSVTFFACDPLDETYEELDKTASDPTAVQVFSITLTEDDYELLDNDDIRNSFESEDQAKELIPVILDKLYPQLGDGSSITVTYNLTKDGPSTLSLYTGAETYTVSEDDYFSVDSLAGLAGFFNNSYKATDYIPEILTSNIQDPVDGQLMAVNYEYAAVEYDDIEGVVVYEDNFDANIEAYNAQSIVGAQEWYWSSFGGDGYAKMSGFSSGNQVNEDWLVTPAIDLTSQVDVVLKFQQACAFMKTGVFGETIAVKISTDSTNWTDLEVDKWPTGDDYDYDYVESQISLKDYEGEIIYIAFYYTSTVDYAPTWQISSILVEAGETILTSSSNAFYQYDNSDTTWSALDESNVYYLASEDYDAMGAPGQFDNFSSSLPTNNYIPQFLKAKFPYAQEEDEIVVVYKYYSSSEKETQTRANIYTYTNGQWEAFAATLQFGKEEGVWVPDNTIRYTFTPQDYTDVGENASLASEAAIANLQRFGNFNTNEWTPEELLKAIGFILKERFPNSEVGQKYLVTYNTYPGGDLEMHVILNADGEYELK